MSKKASQKRRTDVVELVKESLLNGPVSLSLYAQIVQCDSSDPASWERSARRLVKRLREEGHEVITAGDAERLTIDLSKARDLLRAFPEVNQGVSPGQSTRGHTRTIRDLLGEVRCALRVALSIQARVESIEVSLE